MAFGGFFGNDPVMSVDAFAKARGARRGAVRGAGHQPPPGATSSAGCAPTARSVNPAPVALAAAGAAAGDRAYDLAAK